MAVEIISELKQKNGQEFPVVDANNIKGGFYQVDTINERDAIPNVRKREGMLCFVKNDPDKIYTYQWSDNAWVKSKIGSGVEKIDTVVDQQNLNPEPGDIIYIKETGQLLQYTKDLIWNSLQTLHISDDEPEDKGVLWLTNAKTSPILNPIYI